MVKKVVIFAGHDHDTWEKLGAKGVRTDLEADGVYEEYDTNFLIAKGAVKILQTVPGLIVYFPQEDGRRMTLKQRVVYANSISADLMIDIHSNAAASRAATGAAAFYWKGSVNGKKAADIYAGHLKKAGFPLWSGGTYASNTTDGWSGFYMLRYSNMPAILLENFFFTTRSDLEKYLLNPAVQLTLMEIVADTATDYFGMKKPAPKPTPVVKPSSTKPKEEPKVSEPRKVSPTHAHAWKWAEDKEFLNGERPGEPVTREQFATVLQRLYVDLKK